jgi:hypothetical protein
MKPPCQGFQWWLSEPRMWPVGQPRVGVGCKTEKTLLIPLFPRVGKLRSVSGQCAQDSLRPREACGGFAQGMEGPWG